MFSFPKRSRQIVFIELVKQYCTFSSRFTISKRIFLPVFWPVMLFSSFLQRVSRDEFLFPVSEHTSVTRLSPLQLSSLQTLLNVLLTSFLYSIQVMDTKEKDLFLVLETFLLLQLGPQLGRVFWRFHADATQRFLWLTISVYFNQPRFSSSLCVNVQCRLLSS